MTRWVTNTVPINVYGDQCESIVNLDWQSDYAKYLEENGLVLDKTGNPVKKEKQDVQRNAY